MALSPIGPSALCVMMRPKSAEYAGLLQKVSIPPRSLLPGLLRLYLTSTGRRSAPIVSTRSTSARLRAVETRRVPHPEFLSGNSQERSRSRVPLASKPLRYSASEPLGRGVAYPAGCRCERSDRIRRALGGVIDAGGAFPAVAPCKAAERRLETRVLLSLLLHLHPLVARREFRRQGFLGAVIVRHTGTPAGKSLARTVVPESIVRDGSMFVWTSDPARGLPPHTLRVHCVSTPTRCNAMSFLPFASIRLAI